MIMHIFRRFAGLPFGLERVDEAASGRVAGAELRAAVPCLLRTGELAAVKKTWGEKLYFIPMDRLPKMWERFAPKTLEPRDGEAVALEHEAGPGLAADLFRALTWIGRHRLPVTAKGTIHQKAVQKLTDYLILRENDVAELGLRYPNQEAYPPQFAVMMDLLQALRLLEKERSFWGLKAEELEGWLGLAPDEMEAVLYRELLHRYVPDDAAMMHFVFRLGCGDLRVGSWYRLEELYASLQEAGYLSETQPERFYAWTEGWLKALAGFGWMDTGKDQQGKRLFRWRRKPDPDASLALSSTESLGKGSSAARNPSSPGIIYVQPDFEIMVPPDVSYRVRFELEAFAENITFDAMSVYRLTRSSVGLASELGRSPEQVLEFLEVHSAGGLPENVRLALLQWAGELGRTSLGEQLLLQCADEATADVVAGLSTIKDSVERIGPKHFIVDGKQAAKVRKALDDARLSPPRSMGGGGPGEGYPRMDGRASTAEGRPGFRGTAADQAWIHAGKEVHFYTPTGETPDPEELFPGYTEIPAIWKKEMRDYHASTAREIMSRAIVWKAKTALQMDGETVEFMPFALNGGEKWTVSGRLVTHSSGPDNEAGAEVELHPEQWRGMRLIMPEIS